MLDLLWSNFTQDEETALIYACSSGNTETVEMLLAHGAILDHRDKVNDLEHVLTHSLTDSMWSYYALGVWVVSSYVCKWFRQH